MTAPPAHALASPWPPGWEIPEETVPESHLHDVILDLLKQILLYWASKQSKGTMITRNLAVRIDQAHPQIGFDPDLAVLSPPPPEGLDLESLCLWKPGHHPPRLTIEVVSPSNAIKDYSLSPARCDAAGVNELWVIDPLLAGPASMGRHLLQVWVRDGQRWLRAYAGAGPFFSPEMQGWLLFTGNPEMARIADDTHGLKLWPTQAEAERAARELESSARKKERAAKEQALSRVAELERRLAELEGKPPKD